MTAQASRPESVGSGEHGMQSVAGTSLEIDEFQEQNQSLGPDVLADLVSGEKAFLPTSLKACPYPGQDLIGGYQGAFQIAWVGVTE